MGTNAPGVTGTDVFERLGSQIAGIRWARGIVRSRQLRVGGGVLERGIQEGRLLRGVEVREGKGCG